MAREKRDPRLELPPLELECMKALWASGEGSVHRVRERLLAARPLAYTTVMTIMNRLVQRGAAARIKRNRAYVYRPLVSKGQVRRQAVGRLVSEHFDGSEEDLRAYLSGEGAGPAEQSNPAAKPQTPAPRRTRPSAPEAEAPSESKIDEALL
jgi:BlaI family transcriptional regulator, penicillinase repressor